MYHESNDGGSTYQVPDSKNEEIQPNEASLRWFVTKSVKDGIVGGPWKYAGASTISPGTLSASHTKTVSNTYSGTLAATIKEVNVMVGFDITWSDSRSVGYTTDILRPAKGKGYRLEFRHKYQKYKVTQQRKYDRRATTSYGTAYVYPQKWLELEYRVVEYTI